METCLAGERYEACAVTGDNPQGRAVGSLEDIHEEQVCLEGHLQLRADPRTISPEALTTERLVP